MGWRPRLALTLAVVLLDLSCNALLGIEERGRRAETVGSGGAGGEAGCAASEECPSGHCADGTCCDGACAGPCEACNLPGSEGSCRPHPSATDPDGDCAGGRCDGSGRCAAGAHQWSTALGGVNDDLGLALALRADGSFVVAGGTSGDVDLGGGVLAAMGDFDVIVASFSATGQHVWSKRFGRSGRDAAWGLALAPDDSIVMVGEYLGDIDPNNNISFGGPPLPGYGGGDAFVVRLAANGDHVFSKGLGDTGYQVAYGVAIDGAGNVVLAGRFDGAIDFGGGPTLSSSNPADSDVFVAKLDASGSHLWSRGYGDPSICEVEPTVPCDRFGSVAADADGNVVMMGTHRNTVDFGGGPLISAGGDDAFVVSLRPDGSHRWSKRFGDAQDQAGPAVVFTASGDVIVSGKAAGTVDFGGGPRTAAGAGDLFVVRLDGDGNHLFSSLYGSAGAWALGVSAAVDPVGGHILVAGYYDGGPVDFGAGPLPAAPDWNGFVLKLAATGEPLWSRGFGAAGRDLARHVRVRPNGNSVLLGDFEGAIDLGGPTLQSAGARDVVLGELGP